MSKYDGDLNILKAKDEYYIEMQRKKLEEEKREKIREEFEYRKRIGDIEFDYASFEKWRRRFKL
jgi:spore maturation protein CgeB